MVEGNMLSALFKMLMKILTAPLWFFDAVDKEKMVLAIPFDIRRRVLKLMFLPTLWWTMLLHRTMPDQRRWYDRVDSRVIIGALPLKSHLETLSRIERVSGVINFCDEFAGHAEYGKVGMRQLRLPTLDYCSPTVQQLEKGLDFIRNQPPGCSTYVHCKAGRGRAGTMLMAYLISERGMSPDMAQRELLRVRPHVSPRLWKRQSVRELYRRKKIQMQEEERERAILEAQERAKLEAAPSLVDGSARVSENPFESEVETTGPTDQPASTSEGAPPIS
ncbi:hypothetical protein AB1Y20_015855 [Prymnesium parvum]|uniref:Protein-tyrosine-phosphatase n=1 Tax=Prymnesium parvum TaxID=97485 RepID=A0AB34K2N8_PRYPA